MYNPNNSLMRSTLLTISIAVVSLAASAQTCDEIFISEYVEGWGNNKAIEIYNPTQSPVNLANYKLARYSNGSTTPSLVSLSGMIQPLDVKVLVLDKRDPNGTGLEEPIYPDLEAVADTFLNPFFIFAESAMYFNGNDAVALLTSSNVIVDAIGRIGEDPGDQWGWTDQNGAVWTKDQTMVRKFDIEIGDANGYDVFWPEVQWDSLSVNTFSGLGSHSCSCSTPPPCETPSSVSYSGLNTGYLVSDGPVSLTPNPAGGLFFGPGVSGYQFDPSTAGVGNHTIVYTYVDGNDCIGSYGLCTTVSLTVGGSDGDLQSIGVDVYPNPSNGDFMVTVPSEIVNSSYSVYNLSGEIISAGMLSSSQMELDLNGESSGVYTIIVNSAEGTHSMSLIKQ